MIRPTWNQLYITMCYLVSARSKDKNTHAGTVIVAPDNTIRSIGYNDLPRGIAFTGDIGEDGLPSRLSPINGEKYKWTEHSERNAVFNACRNGLAVTHCTLYVNWLPCTDCARAILQTGIKRVIVHKQGQEAFMDSRGEDHNMWANDHHNTTIEMFNESGIDLTWFDDVVSSPVQILFSGKLYSFNTENKNFKKET